MADALIDNNHKPTLILESSSTPGTIVRAKGVQATGRLLVDNSGGGSGTVTDVSVVSANGFAGTVADSTTTPAITIETTITGIVKGDGTAIAAAVAGDVDSILPAQAGESGKFLTTDGTNSSWGTPAGAGTIGGTIAATQVAYGSGADEIAGEAAFVYDATTNTLTVDNLDSAGANFSGLTASEIVATDGSKNLQSLAVATYPSLTELSYVKGVTSAIQTQLNAKGVGTVTSVAASVPTGLTISGSPVTTTGTLAFALDTGYVIPLQSTLDGKANTALSNLASVAINTDLISDTDSTDSIGSTAVRWLKGWFDDMETTNMPTVGGTSLSSVTQTFTNKTIGAGTLVLAEGASVALDPTLSADGTYTGITIAGTAGATLAFGDLCYLAAADSRWELADADAASTSGDVLLGMCVLAAAADGDPTIMLLNGNIRADAAFPSLTISALVYVSTDAGDIQVAQPSGTDDVIRVVGRALTADSIYFNPSEDYVTHT